MKTQKLSRSECVSRRQLRIKRVISAKFGNGAHYFITCFAAISLLQEIYKAGGLNFHIQNAVAAIVKVSGNRLVLHRSCDSTSVQTKAFKANFL